MTVTPLPRVAVLGGTGFVGRAILATLSERGHGLLTVARNRPEAELPGDFARFDLTEGAPEDLAKLLTAERVDVVVNAAGGMWGLTDEQMVGANVGMVSRLLEALGSMDRAPRLVHLGTVHEYGLCPIGVSLGEDHVPAPSMVYGRLKLQATELITETVRDQGLDAVVLRLGNVVGAGQPGHSLLGVMAAKLVEARTAGTTAELALQPLTAQRDFVDLQDTVDAIVAALSPAAATPPVLNVGLGRATSARELVELLIEVSGVPTVVTEVAAPAGSGPETEWQQLDITAVRHSLGWQPRRTPREAVAALWAAAVLPA
ncbi:dTDP-6-deoxy-L-talose 4-dehydrogenase [NAD(P)+] [Kitasatospora sp. SolWspMP-SS2h]|uniref:NAD-dependent epimerase/dehydratase family protein n=1 Tax=Kitasatospora sp. SolWspMP-SS2h TaxID=1305729 RepID=UPI000DB967EC|nr:NAD(P)-dependent oxidoreductase [Kitasatospora sp. SolWspMP-SS2h]RAJ38837.1 dTDP-6-deoxy-L-talose 4-dehydrogenase [NAD(P)+] [Kitasatospora sp. SolWspMP-SS2h]